MGLKTGPPMFLPHPWDTVATLLMLLTGARLPHGVLMYFNRYVLTNEYVTGNAYLTLEEAIAEAIANVDKNKPQYQFKLSIPSILI